MKQSQTTPNSSDRRLEPALVVYDRAAMEEAAARQDGAIRQLQADNLASRTENAVLRDINNALESTIAELRLAQTHIEFLNREHHARNAALESLNNEMEAFSYAVSHDLRSPLRSIHGFSEALQQSAAAKLTVEECVWLQKISTAAARLDCLIEDLLRLSRISRSQLKRERVDLSAIARDVVRDLRQSEPRRDVVFAISDGLVAQADPVLMRVVVTNLLDNAWKYTGRRDQALISFSCERGQLQPVFCVRDNGAGFDMAYASKLFAAFHRMHSARDYPGSGVGLSCVARVVHKHGGRIWADAKTNEGAAFFFTIPDGPGLDQDRGAAE